MMFDEKKISKSIQDIRARLDDMEFLVDGLEQYELVFFNTDIQHIFQSLLGIDEQTHFFDGMYKNYAAYLANEIMLRSRGLGKAEKDDIKNMMFNFHEHEDE